MSKRKRKNYKNPESRDHLCGAAIGDKGMGKSSLISQIVDRYLEESIRNGNPKKVLILDPSVSRAFQKYPEIRIQDLERGFRGSEPGTRRIWKQGIMRMNDPRGPEEMLIAIKKYFKNGMLVVDDATVFYRENGTIPIWQKDLILSHRNSCLDLLFVFHRFMDINRALRPHFYYFIMFKIPDTVSKPAWFEYRGFNDSEHLYEKYREVMQLPYYPDRIIQEYVTYYKDFSKMYPTSKGKSAKVRKMTPDNVKELNNSTKKVKTDKVAKSVTITPKRRKTKRKKAG